MRILTALLPLAALFLATPSSAGSADAVVSALADPARGAEARALDAGRQPAEVLAFAAIRPGAKVVDWMAGQGYYSELLADVVGKRGHVFAVEAQEFYKPEPWTKVTAAHPNIEVVVKPFASLAIAPGSADVIFSHLTYHDLYLGTVRTSKLTEPQVMLAMWRAALKPGGTVIIADHDGPAGDPTDVAHRLHRIAVATAKAEMARAGFELVGESDVLRRSDDMPDKMVFDPAVRGHTSRFLLKFKKK